MKNKSNSAAYRTRTPKTAVVSRQSGRRTAYLIVIVLVAVLIIAAAVVLRTVSDQRMYNDYMKQAQQSYSGSDYDNALAALRKAASIDKTDECLMLMATCYETQGNYTKALEVLRMMDVQNPVVASKISSIESYRKTLSDSEKITIAGRQFPASTTSLVLDNMELTDAVIEEILQLYSIDSLSLSGNAVRDISGLSYLGGLVTLNLSGNQVNDIRPLSTLTGLRTLYLDNNPVSDLSPLCSLTNLTSLSIKGINITEKQLEALSKALPNCAIHSEAAQEEILDITFGGVTFKDDVTELDLNNMGIRDISALAVCQRLKRLNLSGNDVSDLSPLMNLPELEWLDISYNQVSDVRPLMGVDSLRFLNAAGNNISSTSALSMMNGLTTLYLDENPIHDFSGLRKIKTLLTLGLNSTGLNDDGLYYLRGMTLLSTLNVEDNADLSGEAVDELAMTLGNCTINHSELSYIIDIDNHAVQTDTVTLALPGQGIVDISNLAQLSTLENVDLSGNFISNIYPLEYSDSRFTIKNLNLSTNGIRDITPLAKLMNIETLDLSFNDINSELPLMNLFTLRRLVLTGNPLSEEQIENLRFSLVDCEIIF